MFDMFLSDSIPQNEEQLQAEIKRGRVYRLNDKFFKFAFGRPDHKLLFLDLVNAIVFPDGKNAFVDINFVDREFSPLRVDGKECRLDIVGILDGGEQINIETQVCNEGDYEKRSVCNWSVVHFTQLARGMMYIETKKTITINILAFDLFKSEPHFRNSFSIRNDESGTLLCEDLCIIYLEIAKYKRANRKPINKLERWMAYFAGLEGEEMAQIAEKEPMINTAIDIEKMFLMDHMQRLAYVMSWKDMMYEANRERRYQLGEEKALKRGLEEGLQKGLKQGLEQGLEEGLEQGLEQGELLARQEMARTMLGEALPPELISKFTGFSKEEIEALHNA